VDNIIKKYKNKNRLKNILILLLVPLLLVSVAINIGFVVHRSVYVRLYYFRMDDIESYQDTVDILNYLSVRHRTEYTEVLIDADLLTYATSRVIAVWRVDAYQLLRHYVSLSDISGGWGLLDTNIE